MTARLFAFASIVFSGAIFGFFYAWVCSTMWGLDRIDPNHAIEAMQAMNASVRNGVFAPAFFGTPIVLLITAIVAWKAGSHRASYGFIAALLVYLAGAFFVTTGFNVPLNQSLVAVQTPMELMEAENIWTAYSSRWQLFNQLRTVASGLSLMAVAFGLYQLGRSEPAPAQ